MHILIPHRSCPDFLFWSFRITARNLYIYLSKAINILVIFDHIVNMNQIICIPTFLWNNDDDDDNNNNKLLTYIILAFCFCNV
jgi:hypothetical protein